MTVFLTEVVGIEVVKLTACKPRRRRFEHPVMNLIGRHFGC
jgi:hypothetical protein